jgi:hypothetical protein
VIVIDAETGDQFNRFVLGCLIGAEIARLIVLYGLDVKTKSLVRRLRGRFFAFKRVSKNPSPAQEEVALEMVRPPNHFGMTREDVVRFGERLAELQKKAGL